ncbi:competence type IV pilus ATPase ComGA [Liquorilactobacillus vini]|uniref:ComG operon protein 1 n=1 Tax=Liquorilactobacillus vini DSM 20605 TaxID=1133569 RepID=A0A0R2C731_9LACO|nr:competence type IV pilus ATPase ComGA [Liquorilactobacillus vini]KRM87029.1 ComG operon protein 1 [Liquorilactobacillus vini DSM 20605]
MEVEKFVKEFIAVFIRQNASDVYITQKNDFVEIKFLAGNFLKKYRRLSIKQGIQLINFLKFKGGLMLSEHRRPQTGSIIFAEEGQLNQKVFGRISTIGDFQGFESLVLRLIYQQAFQQDNFFFPDQFQHLKIKAQEKGLILLCGPVGSGKTTTMYQLAKSFSQVQIMTIEDPVEIYEPSFQQFQVNFQAQMSYLELLKAALRHRPDILIIGEIRDAQTASAVIDAALSGHLVFSTLHANCANSALKRLIDWQIPASDLWSSIRLINYQRLIPTLDMQFKLLCEQLLITPELFNSYLTAEISHDWRENLDFCQKQNWISAIEKENFWYG